MEVEAAYYSAPPGDSAADGWTEILDGSFLSRFTVLNGFTSLGRRRGPPVSLRQVDPLIRQLTLYRDLIEQRTKGINE